MTPTVLELQRFQAVKVFLVVSANRDHYRRSCPAGQIISYVRDGGTAILAGYFAAWVNWFDPHGFFRRWELPWEYGSYTRATVYVNLRVRQIDKVGLPAAYHLKALFLKNVSQNEALYHPLEDCNRAETPVAFGAVGKGRLGYIGDVNGEEGTNAAIVAMCGL